MRKEFAQALVRHALSDERFLLLSGDLGFLALEELRDRLGKRFINGGISEQNLVSVAAGLASKGFQPWVYSIAPFAVFRPYEQIRNDVCLHRLDVKIIGNGGGYGYGIMGSTHHALEDVGAMRLLPSMRCYLPVFSEDVEEAVLSMQKTAGPAYLRLNLSAAAMPPREPFQCWRRLASGDQLVAITMGPIAEAMAQATAEFGQGAVELVGVGQFPLEEPPRWLLEKIESTGKLVTLEEHVGAGGLGEAMAHALLPRLSKPVRFLSLSAAGYPSGLSGSQRWHQEDNGLSGLPLKARLREFMGGSVLG